MNMASFWPRYLEDHQHVGNRIMHLIGSASAIVWVVAAIVFGQPWFLLAALVNAYGFAWLGHFVIERNRPATLKYPIKSFLSDWRMVALMVTGRLGRHLNR